MTDTQGLRFDIYERVHLPEQVKGIEQLDQIELLPNIQVQTQGDQAVLTGHLKLTGQYGGDARSAGKLEHAIPVEITLPLYRVPDLNRVQMEIEHFDVDVIAPGTLNVIGVLSLRGIVTDPYVKDRQEEAEETVFVHERLSGASAAGANDASLDRGDVSAAVRSAAAQSSAQDRSAKREDVRENLSSVQEDGKEPTRAEAIEKEAGAEPQANDTLPQPQFHPQQHASQAKESLSSPLSGGWPQQNQTTEENAVPAIGFEFPESGGRTPVSESVGAFASNEPAQVYENTFGVFDADESSAFAAAANPQAEVTDDPAAPPSSERPQIVEEDAVQPKPEPKVALSGRKPDGEQVISASELTSLLQKSTQVKGARGEADTEKLSANAQDAKAAHASNRDTDAAADKLEWRKLFLSRGEEERQFASVRLCIVQKEETIESIAERYRLNPREIALYNGLGSQELQEGQVLYIPK